jgi:isoaspartyl peptidase/L-asparaginase-like protein (Ntn-hydrolase superfamily)
MVTEGAVRRYKANRESLDNTAPFNPVALSEPHDTVGSVVLDSVGNLAVAVSTGGISLKRAGRVGDTAIPGSGFWLNQYTLNDQFRIACCTTGMALSLLP